MRVLIVKTSSMGDVIHALPALTDLNQQYPDIKLDWVVEEGFSTIPKLHYTSPNVLPIAWRKWRKRFFHYLKNGEIANFFHQLRSQKYDYIIDAQGLIKSVILTKLAKGPSYGYDFNSAREHISSFFYQHKYAISWQDHAIDRMRKLFAQSLGYALPQAMPDYGIRNLDVTNPFKNQKYAVFVHGTSRDDKLWSEQSWRELAAKTNEAGTKVLLPWGNEVEKLRAQRIAVNQADVTVLDKMSLTLLAALLKEAQFVVAVDTGLGHLAAAVDVPTFSLYGTTDPRLIGTVGGAVQQFTNMHQLNASDVWDQIQTVV